MHTVVVPIDFSQASKDSFHYALALGKQFHVRVKLLHVHVPEPGNDLPDTASSLGKLSQKLHEKQRYLENWVNQVPREIARMMEIVAEVRIGKPAMEILDCLSFKPGCLLVLGIKKKRELGLYINGDVCHQLLKSLSCPMLIVPEGNSFQPYQHVVNRSKLGGNGKEIVENLMELPFLHEAQIHLFATSELKEEISFLRARYKQDIRIHDFFPKGINETIPGKNQWAAELSNCLYSFPLKDVDSMRNPNVDQRELRFNKQVEGSHLPLLLFQ